MVAVEQHSQIGPPPWWVRAAGRWLGPTEPHLARGPFARWPRASDAALAALVFAISLVSVAASAIEDGEDFRLASIGDRPLGAIALLALAAAALWWRRARPITVTWVVLAVMLVWALAAYGDGQDAAVVVAGYSVGRYTTDARHSLATVTTIAVVGTVGTLIDANQRVDIAPALILSGVPWYVGRRLRNRGDYLALLQERAERRQAEQRARARQAVAEERARIARELHDVVAHRVSMMTVQAGAAKTVAVHDLEAAVEAMGDVERAGRQALGELRHLVGVLRPDDADADQLGPQPGLADVPALVDELSRTGASVTSVLPDRAIDLTAALDLSIYRIVQESVTNIVKHAGANPRVEIAIAAEDRSVVIDITNTIDAPVSHLPASQFGIVGMRERASQLGGSLTAGVEPTGRYRVHARLPLDPGAT